MGCNYLSIPKLQWYNRWISGMVGIRNEICFVEFMSLCCQQLNGCRHDILHTVSTPLRLHRWSFGIVKLFHPTHYNGCDYLPMLGLKLNHVSKRGPEWVLGSTGLPRWYDTKCGGWQQICHHDNFQVSLREDSHSETPGSACENRNDIIITVSVVSVCHDHIQVRYQWAW